MKLSDVKYLSLEGGGGKGYAYLGAIEALQECKVLDKIEGFSGSSAGAITAFLLSIGYTTNQLENFLSKGFNGWWDSPIPRLIPSVGKPYTIVENKKNYKDLGLTAIKSYFVGPIANAVVLTDLIKLFLTSKDLEKAEKSELYQIIKRNWNPMISFLPDDMGLFSGQKYRDNFNMILANQANLKKNRISSIDYKNMSFKKHLEIFNKRLILTGSNITTGKTVLFSETSTPDFPVADAVRISMGFPFIFKPYVIKGKENGWPPTGVYVDGGLYNNNPFREMEGEGSNVLASFQPPSSSDKSLPLTKTTQDFEATSKTLVLSLKDKSGNDVNNFYTFINRILFKTTMVAGETQITERYRNQVIELDTVKDDKIKLDTLDFSPEENIQKYFRKTSKDTVKRFFEC